MSTIPPTHGLEQDFPLQPSLLKRIFSHSATSGVLLLLAAVAALVWANSPLKDSYHHLWHDTYFTISLGQWTMSHYLGWWVNDLLMVIFFLLVGMEIKKELLFGRLSSPKKAAAPAMAALGGMIFPAAIFLFFCWGTDRKPGWGVPMATDIAFSLAVLAVLGRFVSPGMRVFLVALAIVDDLGALLVIAFFYTADLNTTSLMWAGAVLAFLILLNQLGVRSILAYIIPGIALWALILASGIHATIAGVLLAMSLPAVSKGHPGHSPLETVEHAISPWVNLLILPIFALANSGVTLGGTGTTFGELSQDVVVWGIILGLVVGKPIGIWLFTTIGTTLKICEKPEGTTSLSILALGAVGGIGFTMALFIAKLAFPTNDAALNASKLAVLCASALSALIGSILLIAAYKHSSKGQSA